VENKSVKEIQSEQTRERILESATRLFARKGYYGASIAQLAAMAGLTKGALYHHFKDKEALFAAVVARVRSNWEKAVVRDVLKEPDAPARLRALFDNHTRLICADEALCLVMSSLVSEMDDLSPALAAEVRKLYADFARFIGQIIQKGQAAGQLRKDVDADMTALTAVELLRSACSHLHDQAADNRRKRMEAAREIFLGGLL